MAIIKYSQDENKIIYQRIRDEISIVDYVMSRGFQLKKKGKYYKIIGKKKCHDYSSIMINSETNRYKYYAAENVTRTIIDLVMLFDNCDITAAINTLKPMLNDTTFIRQSPLTTHNNYEKRQIEITDLPERADTMKNVYAYLTKTRHINNDVVDFFIYNEMLYQDNNNNCVFVRYDKTGQPTYCCKRGTSTYKSEPFMWEDEKNDLTHCFFIDNGADTLVVNEGIIDTMSIMTILLELNNNISRVNYVSLGGAGKYDAIATILKENPLIKKVVCALDNDKAGHRGTEKIHNIVSTFDTVICIDFYPYTENDWNEQLVYFRQNNISVSSFIRQNIAKEDDMNE